MIDAKDSASIEGGFANIADDILGTSQQGEEHAPLHVKAKIKHAKARLREHAGWMLIFDNADPNIDLETQHFPENLQGVIVINGCQQQLKSISKGPARKVLELGAFSQEIAIDMFRKSLMDYEDGKPIPSEHLDLIGAIVARLDRNPLAIDLWVPQVCYFGRHLPLLERLEMCEKDCNDYGQGVSSDKTRSSPPLTQRVQDLLGKLKDRERQPNEKASSRDALELLPILLCLGSEPLNLDVIEHSWHNWVTGQSRQYSRPRRYPTLLQNQEIKPFSRHSIHTAIELLDDHSLIQITDIEPGQAKKGISFNTFVKGQIFDYLKSNGVNFTAVALSAISMLVHSVSWEQGIDHWDCHPRLQTYLSAALDVLKRRNENYPENIFGADSPEIAVDTALKVAKICNQGGLFQDAETILTFTQSAACITLGLYNTASLRAMCEMATTHMILDRSAEARDIRGRVLKIRTEILERQFDFSFFVSCVLRNLSVAWNNPRGLRWKVLEPAFCGNPFGTVLKHVRSRWAQDICGKNNEIMHVNLLHHQQIRMNYADSQATLPNVTDKKNALKIRRNVAFQRILALKNVSAQPTTDQLLRRIEASRKTALSLRDLKYYRMSLLLRKKTDKTYGDQEDKNHLANPILRLKLRRDLAESYEDLGHNREARKILTDAFDHFQKGAPFSANHIEVILCEGQLARNFAAAHDYESAIPKYQDVETQFGHLLGDKHRLSLGAAEDLVYTLMRQGDLRAALKKQRQVILVKRDRYDDHNEEVLTSLELAVRILMKDHELARFAPKIRAYVVNTLTRRGVRNDMLFYESLNTYVDCLTCGIEEHSLRAEENVCSLCCKAQDIRLRILCRQRMHPDIGINHRDTLRTMSGLATDFENEYSLHFERRQRSNASGLGLSSKGSISISARDPSNSDTIISTVSGAPALSNSLKEEWRSFLGEDTIDESKLGPLPDGSPPYPALHIREPMENLSVEDLKGNLLRLRERVLEQTIKNSRVAMGKGEDTESQKGQNRFVKQADEELRDTQSLFDPLLNQREMRLKGKVEKWLISPPDEMEDPETKSGNQSSSPCSSDFESELDPADERGQIFKDSSSEKDENST